MKGWLWQVFKVSLNWSLVVSFVFIFLSALSTYLGPLKISVNSKNVDQKTLFSVSGEGSVAVKPDIAAVSMGIAVQDLSVTQGQKRANETINKTTKVLTDLGVTEKDIKTISYNIFPNYNYIEGKQTLAGYNINIDLKVLVRDFERLNRVIDAATASGVNQIGGVSFDVEKKEDALNQARAEAVKKAKEKAARLAGLAGLRLGKIVNLQESSAGERPPYIALEARGIGGGGETQIQPGQTEIKLTVTLEYETL